MRLQELREVCGLITDGTHYTPPDLGAGFPFLTVKDIGPGGELDFVRCAKISEDEFKRACQGNSAPVEGDVLFSKDGTVGKVSVVRGSTKFAVLSSIAILRPDRNLIDSDYLGHVLRSPAVVDQALKKKTGSAIRRIILSDLKSVRFPVPKLSEQQKIAAILEKADALRAKRREAIDKLEQLLQSVFLDMFGDPVVHPRAEVVELSELCSRITDGTHQSPTWSDAGVPFIFQSNVKPYRIDFDTKRAISEDEYELLTARCPIEYGDVLFTIVGSYGNAAMVRTHEKFCFQRHIAHLKPKEDVLPDYLEAVLNQASTKRQADERVTGIAQKTLILRELRSLKVFRPSIEKQKEFSAVAASIREQKVLLQRLLEQHESLFSSLQHRVMSGPL